MGAECRRCGNDIYDECHYCKVKDERDALRDVLIDLLAAFEWPVKVQNAPQDSATDSELVVAWRRARGAAIEAAEAVLGRTS